MGAIRSQKVLTMLVDDIELSSWATHASCSGVHLSSSTTSRLAPASNRIPTTGHNPLPAARCSSVFLLQCDKFEIQMLSVCSDSGFLLVSFVSHSVYAFEICQPVPLTNALSIVSSGTRISRVTSCHRDSDDIRAMPRCKFYRTSD